MFPFVYSVCVHNFSKQKFRNEHNHDCNNPCELLAINNVKELGIGVYLSHGKSITALNDK